MIYKSSISASPLRLGGERPAAWNQLFPGFPPSCMSTPLAAKTAASTTDPPYSLILGPHLPASGLPFSSFEASYIQSHCFHLPKSFQTTFQPPKQSLPKAPQRVSKGTQNHTKDPLEDHKNHNESTTSPQDHPNRSPTPPLTHKTPPKDLPNPRKNTIVPPLSQQL